MDARSPSSRRAWIEIEISGKQLKYEESPSSRRAWIEITPLDHEVCLWYSRPPRGGRG